MSIERRQIVKNGCVGSCCEGFTLPFYVEDLVLMKEAQNKGQQKFTDSIGVIRRVITNNDVDKLIDMLIFKEHTNINPNGGHQPNIEEKENYKDPSTEFSWVVEIDGQLMFRLYTCKHFDKEQRICTDYENRPNMCKHFGSTCAYTGCSFRQNKRIESKIQDTFNPYNRRIHGFVIGVDFATSSDRSVLTVWKKCDNCDRIMYANEGKKVCDICDTTDWGVGEVDIQAQN